MTAHATIAAHHIDYPVDVHIAPALHHRNRLTSAFRPILAIPHLVLVGGPMAAAFLWTREPGATHYEWTAGGGALGAVALLIAVIAWCSILFTGRYPEELWKLAAMYLRWRVRSSAYVALLRDEFPPFGDGIYAAWLTLEPPTTPRDRMSVAFRPILVIPQLLAVCMLTVAWLITTLIAWVIVVITGSYPQQLYSFGVNVLRWNTRVEAYLLLLRDEYPPFSMDDSA